MSVYDRMIQARHTGEKLDTKILMIGNNSQNLVATRSEHSEIMRYVNILNMGKLISIFKQFSTL